MEKNIDKQRSSKIIIVSILIIMLLASVFLFFDSLKLEYKTELIPFSCTLCSL